MSVNELKFVILLGMLKTIQEPPSLGSFESNDSLPLFFFRFPV